MVCSIKTVALIPLRGGSKTIPKKNIKDIAGKPLCAWVLEAAVNSNKIDEVYVSTESPEIIEVIRDLSLGINLVKRPDQYATDDASTESVIIDFMKNIEFDRLVTIQATSPLLLSNDLDSALDDFEIQNCDSMLSVVRAKRFFWNEDGTPINYDVHNRPRRQEFKGTLMENGAFYITTRETLLQYNNRLGGKIGLFEMAEETSIEIDEPLDWDIVKQLLKAR